jgi:Na+-driven multidrug efflux pump
VVLLLAGRAAVQSFMGSATSASALGAGQAYLAVRAAGAPVNCALLVLQAACRGMNSAALSLRATLVNSAVNLVLDPVAIFVFALGLPGAAAATVVGQVRS